MDTIVFATDLHLTDKQPVNRITTVEDRSIVKLNSLLQIAADNDGVLLLGGDFFEVPCPSYNILNEVIASLRKFEHSVKVYLVRGNHDFRFLNDFEDTAVSALDNAGLIKIVDVPIFVNGFNIVPFPYSKQLPLTKAEDAGKGKYDFYAHEILAEGDGHPILTVTHHPIVTTSVPYDHILYKDIYTDADYLLCGHIHMRFEGKFVSANKTNHQTVIVNPGCIMRLKRNEATIIPSAVLIHRRGSKVFHEFVEITKGKYNTVEFTEPKKELVSFTKVVKEEEKIDISDVESYIMNSTYSKEVKNASLALIRKQQEVMND